MGPIYKEFCDKTSEKLTTTAVGFKIILHNNWKQNQSFCHLACIVHSKASNDVNYNKFTKCQTVRNANDEVMRPR